MDWAALMAAGLTRLRLKPDELWALTPAELRLMLGDPQTVAPLDRAGLDRLAAAFPDDTGPGPAGPAHTGKDEDGDRNA